MTSCARMCLNGSKTVLRSEYLEISNLGAGSQVLCQRHSNNAEKILKQACWLFQTEEWVNAAVL